MAIASGLATFAGLQALSALLPSAARFSQISTAAMLFTHYLIFVDLGTHARFLEHAAGRAQGLADSDWRMLLKARFALALLALPLAAGHALVGRFSAELSATVLILQAGLLWVAYTSSLDTWRMACGRPAHAVTLRLSRIAGIASLVAWTALWPETPLWAAGLALQLGIGVCTFAFAALRTKGAARESAPRQHRPSDFPAGALARKEAFAQRDGTYAFLRSSLPFGLLTMGLVGQQLLLHAVLVRDLGETQLAGWNAAIILATPFVLGFQTLTQIALPSLLAAANAEISPRARAFLRFCGAQCAIAAGAAAALWIAARLDLPARLFHGAGADLDALTLLLLLNQLLLNLLWPLLLLIHRRGRFRAALSLVIAAGALGIAVQTLLTQRFGLTGAAHAQILLAGAQLACGMALLFRGRGP